MFWKSLEQRCIETLVRDHRCLAKSALLTSKHRRTILEWLVAHDKFLTTEFDIIITPLLTPPVTKLDLESSALTDEFLKKLAESSICENLEELKLCFAFRSVDQGMEALLGKSAHLKSLDLRELKVDTDPFWVFKSDRLETLVLQLYVRDFEWHELDNLILRHKSMKKIAISIRGRTLSPENQLLRNLVQTSRETLLELELNNFAADKESLAELILGCLNLKQLKLSGGLQLDPVTMMNASKLCHWEAVDLTFQVTPPVETYQALQYLPKTLDSLGLKFGPSNRNLVVPAILKLPSLTKMRYHTEFFNDNLTEKLLTVIGKNLVSVDIGLCETISDRGLGIIADNCNSGKLQALYVHSDMNKCNRECTGMSLLRLVQVQACSTVLTVIYLNHFRALAEEILRAIATECLNLEELYLRAVRTASDSILVLLAQNCKQLHSLDVAQCWSITDRGIEAIAGELPLKYLNVAMCIRITTGSISALINNCLFLEHFICNGAPNVRKEEVEALKGVCFKRLKSYYYHWFS